MNRLRIALWPKAPTDVYESDPLDERVRFVEIPVSRINLPKAVLDLVIKYWDTHGDLPAAIVMGWQTAEVFKWQMDKDPFDLRVPIFTDQALDVGFSLLHPPDKAIQRMMTDGFFEDYE